MVNTHISLTESTSELADRLARDTQYKAICDGDPQAMSKLQQQGSIGGWHDSFHKCANENEIKRQGTPLGQRQVESLLCFMVSPELERELEDAEGDNVVYDGLGEHRILGKKKKIKKSRTISY